MSCSAKLVRPYTVKRTGASSEQKLEKSKREHWYQRPVSDSEDDLVLFHGIQSKGNTSLLSSSSHEDLQSSRMNECTHCSTREQKSEFDWLLTPPGSPYPLSDNRNDVFLKVKQQSTAVSAEDKAGQWSLLEDTRPDNLLTTATLTNRKTSGLIANPRRRTYSTESFDMNPRTEHFGNRSANTPRRRSVTPPANHSRTSIPQTSHVKSRGTEFMQRKVVTSPGKQRHGSSYPKLQAWQSRIPGFSLEAPPNLLTALPNYVKSRSRRMSPSSTCNEHRQKPRRQSISPTVLRHMRPLNSCDLYGHSGNVVSSFDDYEKSTRSSKKTSHTRSASLERVTQRKESILNGRFQPASTRQTRQPLNHHQSSTLMGRPVLLDLPAPSVYSHIFRHKARINDQYHARFEEDRQLLFYSEYLQDASEHNLRFYDRGIRSETVEEGKFYDSNNQLKEQCQNLAKKMNEKEFEMDVAGGNLSVTYNTSIHDDSNKRRTAHSRAECNDDKSVGDHTLELQTRKDCCYTSSRKIQDGILESPQEDMIRKIELETMQKHDTWLRKHMDAPGPMEINLIEQEFQNSFFSVDSYGKLQDELLANKTTQKYRSLHVSHREVRQFEQDDKFSDVSSLSQMNTSKREQASTVTFPENILGNFSNRENDSTELSMMETVTSNNLSEKHSKLSFQSLCPDMDPALRELTEANAFLQPKGSYFSVPANSRALELPSIDEYARGKANLCQHLNISEISNEKEATMPTSPKSKIFSDDRSKIDSSIIKNLSSMDIPSKDTLNREHNGLIEGKNTCEIDCTFDVCNEKETFQKGLCKESLPMPNLHLETVANERREQDGLTPDPDIATSQMQFITHELSICNDPVDCESYSEIYPATDKIGNIAQSENINVLSEDQHQGACGGESRSPEAGPTCITKNTILEKIHASEISANLNNDAEANVSGEKGEKMDITPSKSNDMSPEHICAHDSPKTREFGGLSTAYDFEIFEEKKVITEVSHNEECANPPTLQRETDGSLFSSLDSSNIAKISDNGGTLDSIASIHKEKSTDGQHSPQVAKTFNKQHDLSTKHIPLVEHESPLLAVDSEGRGEINTMTMTMPTTTSSAKQEEEMTSDVFAMCYSLLEDIVEKAMTQKAENGRVVPLHIKGDNEELAMPHRRRSRQGYHTYHNESEGMKNVVKGKEREHVPLRVITVPQRDAIEHERRRRQKCHCGCHIL